MPPAASPMPERNRIVLLIRGIFEDGAEIDANDFAQNVRGVVTDRPDIGRLEGIEAETRADCLLARAAFQLRGASD